MLLQEEEAVVYSEGMVTEPQMVVLELVFAAWEWEQMTTWVLKVHPPAWSAWPPSGQLLRPQYSFPSIALSESQSRQEPNVTSFVYLLQQRMVHLMAAQHGKMMMDGKEIKAVAGGKHHHLVPVFLIASQALASLLLDQWIDHLQQLFACIVLVSVFACGFYRTLCSSQRITANKAWQHTSRENRSLGLYTKTWQ